MGQPQAILERLAENEIYLLSWDGSKLTYIMNDEGTAVIAEIGVTPPKPEE